MEAKCSVHKLIADVAPLSGGKVLLVRYRDTAKYDGQGGWFLPDDFLRHGEHPREAARRILREQAGIDADGVALRHVESFGDGAWHLIFHHAVELPRPVPPVPGENVADARWFPLGSLPPKQDVAHDGWALDVLREILAQR